MTHSSKALANEEGRVLRAGHKFRRGFLLKQEHYYLLASPEDICNDPAQVQLIRGLLEEVAEDNDAVRRKIDEKGVIQTFQEEREQIITLIRDSDPDHWAKFIESQEITRANAKVGADGSAEGSAVEEKAKETKPAAVALVGDAGEKALVDEEAVSD